MRLPAAFYHNGQPLSEDTERFVLLATTFRKMAENFVRKRAADVAAARHRGKVLGVVAGGLFAAGLVALVIPIREAAWAACGILVLGAIICTIFSRKAHQEGLHTRQRQFTGSIRRCDKVHLSFASFPFDTENLLLADLCGFVPATRFDLPFLSANAELDPLREHLEAISQPQPVIFDPDPEGSGEGALDIYGQERDTVGVLQRSREIVLDRQVMSVELALLGNVDHSRPFIELLRSRHTQMVPGERSTPIQKMPAAEAIRRMAALAEARDADTAEAAQSVRPVEAALRDLQESVHVNLDRQRSTREITLLETSNKQIGRLLRAALSAACNHYCERCLARAFNVASYEDYVNAVSVCHRAVSELNDSQKQHLKEVKDTLAGLNSIKSAARLHYDPTERQWVCGVCDARYSRSRIRIARIKDEIVFPMWQQLWAELDVERARIEREIQEQKFCFRDEEYKQKQEAMRNFKDAIRDLRARIRELEATSRRESAAFKELLEVMHGQGYLDSAEAEGHTNAIGGVESKSAEIKRDLQEKAERTSEKLEEEIQGQRDKRATMGDPTAGRIEGNLLPKEAAPAGKDVVKVPRKGMFGRVKSWLRLGGQNSDTKKEA